ncbi:amino acid ABC transporter ATP-binding protein [Gordonia sp. NPDC058843]|uniref:amino acid ABC transporter ATP-binding protein n=1 Tax=Gordonia sp. NPDC058843 TaxID=3346648 RepID=UPI0036C70B9E
MITATTEAAQTTTADPLLRVAGVSKSFGALRVLDHVDLSVARGEVLGIVGPSGSGKSTLLRSISQLEEIDSGAIWFDGELLGYETRGTRLIRLRDSDLTRQRRRTGMVFQQFNLFPHLTALDNVIHAPIHVRKLGRARARELGMELLEQVDLADRASHYPSELSGGQQQRVAIARALAMEPDLLLFDEPTSALDPHLVDEVLRVIRGLAAARTHTMVIVTHEMNFARKVASRIAFMDKGSVVRLGAPDDVFGSAEPVIRAFFDSPHQQESIARSTHSKGIT